MIKLVICNSEYCGAQALALKKARAATQYGFKKCWSKDLIGSYAACELLYYSFKKNYSLLSWDGPNDQFLIFKLAENTNLIKAHIEIDNNSENNESWKKLLAEYNRYCVHVRDRFENRFNYSEINRIIRQDSSQMGLAMLEILAPIVNKLK